MGLSCQASNRDYSYCIRPAKYVKRVYYSSSGGVLVSVVCGVHNRKTFLGLHLFQEGIPIEKLPVELHWDALCGLGELIYNYEDSIAKAVNVLADLKRVKGVIKSDWLKQGQEAQNV
jgi:hypothetical protein